MKLTQIEELPSWFKIENYSQHNLTTVPQWFEQLYVRSEILKEIRSYAHTKDKELPCILNKFWNTTFANVYDSYGECDFDKNHLPINPFCIYTELGLDFTLVMNIYESPSTFNSVRDANFNEFHHNFCTLLQKQKNEIIQDSNSPFLSSLKTEPLCYYQDSSKEIGPPPPLISINLNLPDNVLVKQFSQYITAVRKREKQAPKKDTQIMVKISKWEKRNVLAYLDLYSWAELYNRHIPNKFYVETLFPNHDEDPKKTMTEENIRKTVHPSAMNAVSSKTLALLRAEAT